MSIPLIDKSMEGRLRRMRSDIDQLFRRLRTALPDPIADMPSTQVRFGPTATTVTAAAATWANIDAALSVTLTPIADLEVSCAFSANVRGDGTVYGMIGMEASGGVTLGPDYDQVSGVQQFGLTAFSAAAALVTVYGSKTLILPAGVPTTLTMRGRRNTTAYAPATNYAMMRVEPRRWV